MGSKKKESELISVIVPIYKVEDYLLRCVQSIQKQTYQNLEIILIDDGSPDDCGRICDELATVDHRIIVIHKKNGGLSDARNVGIEHAKGHYLTFVDSDDWLDYDMIEILHDLCTEFNADISECGYREIYSLVQEKEKVGIENIVIYNNIEALESMLDWKYFKPMACVKLFCETVIPDVRFPINKLHEDEFTTYKYIYNAKRLVHTDAVKYNYNRMRDDSITAKFKIDNLDACEAFLERREFFKAHSLDLLNEKMNNAYCMVVLDSLYKCYQNNLSGKKLDAVFSQIKKDIKYFKNEPVDKYFINELIIAAHSLKQYGRHRDIAEKDIEVSKFSKYVDKFKRIFELGR